MRALRAPILIASTLTLMNASVSAQDDKPVISDPHRQGRSMVVARNGMVASSHPLASLAGLDMLRAGGTAMDAAVAMAATLGVVEPMSIGIGGDAWFLYYEAKTGKVYAFNGSGRSPKALAREYFDAKEVKRIEGASWESVTVPGAVDAYAQGVERFGNLPLSKLLEPAIYYAENGYGVTEIVATIWATQLGKLKRDEWSATFWLNEDGRAPETGDVFQNPALAESLRKIAEGGRDAFYEGPIAEEIARYARETGGWLNEEDFAAHRGEWVDPISTNYRGYEVYQCPPNGQGMAVLIMLNILEGFALPEMTFNSPGYKHLLIEAKKLAYADLGKYLGDPARGEIPLQGLLSKEYAAERRKLIDPKKAMPFPEAGVPKHGDTAYMTAVDREGNACSFINSLFSSFGSGKSGGSTGILLQNRGNGFTLENGHFNEYKPGVRPYHTIIPGMVTRDGKLYMSYGLMGGDMQPQGHVQFLLAHLDHGLNLQEAIDVPRWRHMEGMEVRLEHGTPEDTADALAAMGHDVKPANYLSFGSAQAIIRDRDTGVLRAGSDSRRDGQAIGY
jgi:gamma-glutamyltranspeptidase/glutathione hydrolase